MSYVIRKKLVALLKQSSLLILLAESNFDVTTGGPDGVKDEFRS